MTEEDALFLHQMKEYGVDPHRLQSLQKLFNLEVNYKGEKKNSKEAFSGTTFRNRHEMTSNGAVNLFRDRPSLVRFRTYSSLNYANDNENALLLKRVIAAPFLFVEATFNREVSKHIHLGRSDKERILASIFSIVLSAHKEEEFFEAMIRDQTDQYSEIQELFKDCESPSGEAMRLLTRSYGLSVLKAAIAPTITALLEDPEMNFDIDPQHVLKSNDIDTNMMAALYHANSVRSRLTSRLPRIQRAILVATLRSIREHFEERADLINEHDVEEAIRKVLGVLYNRLIAPTLIGIAMRLVPDTIASKRRKTIRRSIHTLSRLLRYVITQKPIPRTSGWNEAILENYRVSSHAIDSFITTASKEDRKTKSYNMSDSDFLARKKPSLQRIRALISAIEDSPDAINEIAFKSGILEKCGRLFPSSTRIRRVAVSPLHNRIFFFDPNGEESWKSSLVISELDSEVLQQSRTDPEQYLELRHKQNGKTLYYAKKRASSQKPVGIKRSFMLLKSKNAYVKDDWVDAIEQARRHLLK